MRPAPAPLTVIGGFLGAGKTTLVNHILREASKGPGGKRLAVLVNDFGDLAIDEDLIASHDGQTIALANGCICCTIGNDLFETVMDLMEGDKPPERLIIEASGVADPRPVSELGSLNPHLTRDLTLVVVDAEQIRRQWEDERLRDTVERQLNAANLLIVNKVEDLDASCLADLDIWLDGHAPDVPRVRADRGRIAVSILDDLTVDPGQSSRTSQTFGEAHDHGTQFQTATFAVSPAMSLEIFRQKVKDLPGSVLRAKGYVTLNGKTHLLQKVGPRMSITVAAPGTVKNKIVLIGLGELPDASWFS